MVYECVDMESLACKFSTSRPYVVESLVHVVCFMPSVCVDMESLACKFSTSPPMYLAKLSMNLVTFSRVEKEYSTCSVSCLTYTTSNNVLKCI